MQEPVDNREFLLGFGARVTTASGRPHALGQPIVYLSHESRHDYSLSLLGGSYLLGLSEDVQKAARSELVSPFLRSKRLRMLGCIMGPEVPQMFADPETPWRIILVITKQAMRYHLIHTCRNSSRCGQLVALFTCCDSSRIILLIMLWVREHEIQRFEEPLKLSFKQYHRRAVAKPSIYQRFDRGNCRQPKMRSKPSPHFVF